MEEERQKGKVEEEKDVEDDLADPSEIVWHQLVPVEKAVDAGCHLGSHMSTVLKQSPGKMQKSSRWKSLSDKICLWFFWIKNLIGSKRFSLLTKYQLPHVLLKLFELFKDHCGQCML